MLSIQDILVDNAVAELPFACDLRACKGACCTTPGSKGAPLRDEETEPIRTWSPEIRNLLPAEHRAAIEREGLYSGGPGCYTTTVVNDRACVFVWYEEGIARCAFERAFHDGRIPWQKPISCHLFPIRVRHQTPPFLEFEFIQECAPALERGVRDWTFLDEFLRDALTRHAGADWVIDLQSVCAERRAGRGMVSRP